MILIDLYFLGGLGFQLVYGRQWLPAKREGYDSPFHSEGAFFAPRTNAAEGRIPCQIFKLGSGGHEWTRNGTQ